MIIKSATTLRRFAGPGRCELCSRFCKHRDAHHHFTRQMGGGRRMDVADNLVSVGRWPECTCHNLIGDGKLPGGAERVLELIARREGWPSPEALAEYLTWLSNIATKWTTPEEVQAKRAELRRKAA